MKPLSLGVLSIAGFAVLAMGQGVRGEIPVTFRAEKQVVRGSVIHLEGAVHIAMDDGMMIYGDKADFDVATGDIQAEGNVKAFNINLVTYAKAPKSDWVRINLDKKKPSFFRVRLPGQSDDVATCPELSRLGQDVFYGITAVHTSKDASDAHPKDRALKDAHTVAIATQREAVRLLGTHAKEHGCLSARLVSDLELTMNAHAKEHGCWE